MRDVNFREWLGQRRWKGAPLKAGMIDGRIRRLKRIERALEELGFEERDLDALHAAGRWPELMERLRLLFGDWRSNAAAARRMAPQSPDPTRQLMNIHAAARQYGHFAEGRDPNYDAEHDQADAGDEIEEIDETALDHLRAKFLERFPDFESGGGFAGRSSYHPEEDDYKRPLIAAVQARLAERPVPDEEELGGWLLDQLLPNNALNLVGDYRRKQHLRAVRDRSGGAFERAVGRLTLSRAEPSEAAEAFTQEIWPLVREGSEESKPYGDSRILATLFPAFARPGEAISVATRKFENFAEALLGRKLFGWNPLTAAEYRDALALAHRLFEEIGGWGWAPRDLWDVQGFIWVTCEEKLDVTRDRQADRIRKYALDRFIAPARVRGDATVQIRAGDVHNALGLTAAHANVCQALRGRKFRELAGVGEASVAGPENSSTTTFTFGLGPASPSAVPTTFYERRPTNLILYGPPGTGKTYRTAAEAVRLCDGLPEGDPLLTDPERRGELMARYRQLATEERIDFVTFHQSIGYEDFIEGLRPTTLTQEGAEMASGFRLEPVAGAFRKIAERAEALSVDESSDSYPLAGRKFFKMSLGEAANPEDDYLFEEAMEGGFLHMGDESGIDWSEPRFDSKMAMIDAYAEKHPDEPVLSTLSGAIEFPFTLRHRVSIGDIVIVSKGNLAFRAIGEVTGEYHNVERDDLYTIRRAVRWLWVDREGVSYDVINNKRFSQRTVYELARAELKIDAIQSLIDRSLSAGRGPGSRRIRNFVLVIDEINRANVSKVFGELITLIEPDKRLGEAHELRALLPYSKKPFGVPANLHIVGTMNTADRSIALLDTALRRRFNFSEMPPRPELLPDDVDGVPLRRVLKVMNDRIEYLIDRDHRIGHAFFMSAGSFDRAAVDRAMRDKVIPLLQEYFFEDWSRVAAVLGERPERGGGFLDCRRLKDPTRQGSEDRFSWTVRAEFSKDAYLRLIVTSGADAVEHLEAAEADG